MQHLLKTSTFKHLVYLNINLQLCWMPKSNKTFHSQLDCFKVMRKIVVAKTRVKIRAFVQDLL